MPGRAAAVCVFVGAAVLCAQVEAFAKWRVTKVEMGPQELESKVAAAGRPRLFLTRADVDRLGEAIKTTHRPQWVQLKAAVDARLREGPPEYRDIEPDLSHLDQASDEMLWQVVFDYQLVGMTLVSVLDSDPKYFEAVKRWALKPCTYPHWGFGDSESSDLAAAHDLFGLSIAYDWLYDRWSAEDRAQLRSALTKHGGRMYDAAVGNNDLGWWREEWRNNHAWVNYQGLGIAAIALSGDAPGMGEWLAKSIWAYQHIVAELPDDGSYEEGMGYWGYGMQALMRFITAVRSWVRNDFYTAEYLRRTSVFRLYMSGPQMWQVANFSDSPDFDRHAIRPRMYRLASEYRDGLSQWLADEGRDRGDIDTACWSLLWYDPSVKPTGPSGLPLWQVFQETGLASARTSWRDDALTLHLRSGKTFVSHSHFDVNNFLLNAGGEWLLRDYGYGGMGPGYYQRSVDYFSLSTWGHNCLVIGGRNQRREPDSGGIITEAREQDGIIWFRSDATKAYQGASSVVRDLALILPNEETGKWGYVVVRDQAKTATPGTFDFLLQPGGEVTTGGDTFVIQGKQARLFGRVLNPAGAQMTIEHGRGEHVDVRSPLTLRIAAPNRAQEVEFLVVLVPLAEGEKVPDVRIESGAVCVGEHRVALSGEGGGMTR
jgi:hypothetical protein